MFKEYNISLEHIIVHVMYDTTEFRLAEYQE